MADFFAELKRRQMFRVAAAYAVIAWLLLQLINNLTPALRLPDWAATLVVVLLVAGFPIALLFCWIQHLPSDGSAPSAKTGKLDWLLIGALAVVLSFMGYQQLTTPQAGVDAARQTALNPAGAVSIAVLPFNNLSSDPEQEFFSDGITEEITAALARVPDLRVVGRTSAFQFKRQNQDLRAIGQALSATHLIEGSVRRASDRVRITAQLIKADDGTHIWTENYDRELTDIFAIQEEIARAITASLRMPLGLKLGENLVNSRTIDPESYQQYLRAKALYRARGPANLRNAAALMEEVVARNPDYAPAWALLSWVHTVLPNQLGIGRMTTAQMRDVVQSSREKAEPAAQKAIRLDPNLPDGYVALGTVETRAGKFLRAEELYEKALVLDENHPEALNMYSQMLSYLGLVDKSLALRRRSLALEPFDPNSNRDLGTLLWLSGDDDAALAILKPIDLPVARRTVINLLAGAGRFDEATASLLSAPPGNDSPEAVKEAVRLLRAAPSAAVPQNPVSLGAFDFVYLFTSAPERVLEQYERNVEAGWMTNAPTGFLWHSSYAPARKTERFKAYARNVGFIEYWRAKGWPEFCRPTTRDDFECN
jgi:TolB-like protein/Flp pilus assembly protein TadD